MGDRQQACLVTGASSGLGRAVAATFAGAGYHVVAVGRSKERLAALGDELRGSSAGVTELVCDVARPDELERLDQALRDLDLPLGAAVLSAGQAVESGFLAAEASLERWRDMVLTNVFGAAATARIVLPHLVDSQGALFFIGSVTGRSIVPGDLYSVTKHAVSAMAEALRLEVQDRGVMVCIVQPGLMETPMVSGPRRSKPMMDPCRVAAQILTFAAADRACDVQEIIMRPRPRAASDDPRTPSIPDEEQ